MYITPRQKRKYIIRMAIVAISIPLTVLAAYIITQIVSRAGQESAPEEVVISNLTTNALTVSWVTGAKTTGQVIVVEDGIEREPILDTRGADTRYTHFVEITGLSPGKEYSFKIVSGGEEYVGEGGANFTFTTAPLDDSNPVPSPVFGSISGAGNDIILFIIADGSEQSLPVSAVPSSTGNWILDLSALRTLDGTKLFTLSQDSEISIVAHGPQGKGAVASGVMSELFDDEGKLIESLTLEDGLDVISSLPDESRIIASAGGTNGGDDGGGDNGSNDGGDGTVVNPPPVINPPPVVTPPTTGGTTGFPEPEEVPFDPSTRAFLIKADIPWTNMFANTAPTPTPPDVITGEESILVTNQTDTGFTVVWLTDEPVEGYVKYGTAANSLTEEGSDLKDSVVARADYYAHIVEVGDLLPETLYYYEIYSGDDVYKDGTVPFEFETFETLASPPPFETVTGTIDGLDDPKDAVVLVQIKDKDSSGTSGNSNIVAASPSSSGSWIASIGDARNSNGTEYYTYTDDDEITATLLAYAESDPVTETMENVDDLDIELIAEESTTASSTVQQQNLDPLLSYGISNNSLVLGTQYSSTPKTGLGKPALLMILGGVTALWVGFYNTIIVKSGNRQKKRNMIDNLQ